MEGMYVAQPSWVADKETGQGAETCPESCSQQAEVKPTCPVLPPLQQLSDKPQSGYNCFVGGKGHQTSGHWWLDWEDYL